jgi:FlaA1/EpsC-like NDP-sugar epimerase
MKAILRRVLELRNRYFCLLDAIVFLVTPLLALILLLEGKLALAQNAPSLAIATLLFWIIKLGLLFGLGFYRQYWRYASIGELNRLLRFSIATIFCEILVFTALYKATDVHLPLFFPLIDALLSCVAVGMTRFGISAIASINQPTKLKRCDRALIVGAGSTGIALVKQMQRSVSATLCPVAFIDDDPRKHGLWILGLPVMGDRHTIPHIVHTLQISKVIIAIPSASGDVVRSIVEICQSTGVSTSTLPSLNEIINGSHNANIVRDVNIEDLLRRIPIQTDTLQISKLLRNRRVLITGAGGSIGSELCRQILKCHPAEIVLLGHGENSVFSIHQELQKYIQDLKGNHEDTYIAPQLITFIADIRFPSRLNFIFQRYKPEIVFHAAAHKHVPLMELNPSEAITNNVFGTKNLVDLSIKHEVKHFVMISTDKAVNPTSVMGMSKRVAEMVVLRAARNTNRSSFSVVRFGNVLGSRGSVVPVFKKQIESGGPITVTHPDINRYFMTIPEAVQLVLQASVMGQGGEIFMLDMGEPVKIVDLAKDLIRLSGYKVGEEIYQVPVNSTPFNIQLADKRARTQKQHLDRNSKYPSSNQIDIVFTGLRPGEKLFEELLIQGEKCQPTHHKKLFVVKNACGFIPESLDLALQKLHHAAECDDSDSILFWLKRLSLDFQVEGQHSAALSN